MKYDKTKCQGNLLKGYTGCRCVYCYTYSQLPSKWVVVCHGNHQKFELSLVRDTNRHGKASWGWFDKNKLKIGDGTLPYETFKDLCIFAEKQKEKKNKEEGWA